MGIKLGSKRKSNSTKKPDKRQLDNKKTLGTTLLHKPHKHKESD